MFEDLSPREIVLAAVLGFMLLAGLTQGEPAIILLLAMLGALYYYNRQQRDSARPVRRAARRAPPVPPQPQPRRQSQIYNHALESVQRAGLNPDTMPVLPVDIGVLAFFGADEPIIHRIQPVEDDVDYIQPFVQLRVPVAAKGKIRFEILDDVGARRFVHEDQHDLKRGRNLIIPAARLPIHDEQETLGGWRLRVIADNMLLADHRFTWVETSSDDIRSHVQADGEISNEMRALLAENRLQSMSLDELLADQEDNQNSRPRQAKR